MKKNAKIALAIFAVLSGGSASFISYNFSEVFFNPSINNCISTCKKYNIALPGYHPDDDDPGYDIPSLLEDIEIDQSLHCRLGIYYFFFGLFHSGAGVLNNMVFHRSASQVANVRR